MGGSPTSYTHNRGTIRTMKIHYPMSKKGVRGDGCWCPLVTSHEAPIQMGVSPGKNVWLIRWNLSVQWNNG